MRKTFLRETAGTVMRAIVVVLTILLIMVSVSAIYEVETGISENDCNIAVFPIEGALLPFYGVADFEMVTTPEQIENFMDAAEADDAIDAIMVEINSPGGTPVSSQRIAERLRSSQLPVVGLIGDMGASGGYMVAAASDYLIASPMSDVGSIGVNMSYLEESQKNEEDGITYVQLTTGKYKDIGSPNRPITDEEREILESDLQIIHDEFVGIVSRYRNIDTSKVEELADGKSMPGTKALEVGLVDKLGGKSEAREAFAKILNVEIADIKFCRYERPFLLF